MERFGPGGNFPFKAVHLQRWSSLTGRSGPTDFQKFSFPNRPSSSSLHSVVKMADDSEQEPMLGSCSDVSVY